MHCAIVGRIVKRVSVSVADNKGATKELSNARVEVVFLMQKNSPVFFCCDIENDFKLKEMF
jgi:hypothetical protein